MSRLLIGIAGGILTATAATAAATAWLPAAPTTPGVILIDTGPDAASTLPASLAADLSPAQTAATPSLSAEAPVTRHEIAPSTIDSTAVQPVNKHTGVANNHLTLAPTDAAARRNRLLLFVGGTSSTEVYTQEIVQTGPRRGYHALAIAYPNSAAVGVLCVASLDDDCSAKVREEILTGVDLTPLVTVSSADALEPRLLKLLAYLDKTYPDEGWGAFVRGGAVDWERISAVGHSQGAGHVALLAKRHAMLRSVMISGVADVTALGLPAPWLRRPNVTPVERQYGFTHIADYVVSLPVALASWDAIGLGVFGAARSTDGVPPPYGGSHQLLTALAPKSGTNAHVSMLDDTSMTRNADGTPSHRPVWEFMALPL